VPHQVTNYVIGLKSRARASIPGEEDIKPLHNGFAAYRATVDVEKMRSDPDVAWLLKKPALNIW
jgi:salicylate hydroxylase